MPRFPGAWVLCRLWGRNDVPRQRRDTRRRPALPHRQAPRRDGRPVHDARSLAWGQVRARDGRLHGRPPRQAARDGLALVCTAQDTAPARERVHIVGVAP